VQSQHPPLDKALFLHDEMRRRGLTPGRVSVAVGTFDGAPLAVVEHGMGCPSTEVILREILSDRHCARRFPVPGAADEVFDAPAKFVIRVGTAAGLNRREPRADGSTLREFDLIVCNEQVGISLTDAQALTGHLNLFDPRLLAETRSALVQLGYGFRRLAGAEAPTLATDAELAEALERGAEAGIARFLPAARAVRLGNFSKDSLYAEKHEAEFVALREECGVGSSEMEFSTVARVAQQHTRAGDPVRCGMVAAVLGLIPGDGFSEDHERAAAASSAAMFAAMSALAHVAKQHRRPARP
jgi:uridine phosphorylase